MPSLPSPDTLEISVHDASKHRCDIASDASNPASPAALWIDCREQDEYAICRIEGSTLVPLSNFAAATEPALPEDKDQAIIVYCHHGMRSLRASKFLRQKGHGQVWSMTGGIDLWSQEIDAEVVRY